MLRLEVAVTLCSQDGTSNCSPDKWSFKNCSSENQSQNKHIYIIPHVTVYYNGAIDNIDG